MITAFAPSQHLTIDAVWFRRIFHSFAASFLIYYKLPDATLRISIPAAFFLLVLLLEYLRITKKIDSIHFFGLRCYEHRQPASYIYFGTGMIILLFFFPQPIAIPCILCACFADPLMGELRQHTTQFLALLMGFLLCCFFFAITWSTEPPLILATITLLGATGALLGEVKKFRFIDDDMLIQLFPAILLVLFWQAVLLTGVNILPSPLIQPL